MDLAPWLMFPENLPRPGGFRGRRTGGPNGFFVRVRSRRDRGEEAAEAAGLDYAADAAVWRSLAGGGPHGAPPPQ
ncbi:hypothetical protein [Methylobacterium iners]|uniref:hypothetical protein n=1 Tax=Methylobacterium iners TaxID=418707 RepID=UPI001EE2A347|nr:hypothetical protein [Methylobacterium iners]